MRLDLYTYMPDGKVDKMDYGSGTTSDLSRASRGQSLGLTGQLRFDTHAQLITDRNDPKD